MSEREPITAGLRGMMDTLGWYDEDGNIVFASSGTPASETACLVLNSKTFYALCDAIDAVHAGLEHENAELRQRVTELDESVESMHETDAWKLGYDEGFASADDWLSQHEDAMAEHGWYRALDADKQPIKFDDEVEHNGVVAKVLGITFHGTTPPTVCIVRGDCWVEADELRHYHAPTVEDVLTKMLEKAVGYSDAHTTVATSTIAEYAAKLKLAGDAETCQQEERGWTTEGDHARVFLTCGHDCMVETVADLPNFCPVCGARVEAAK